jgi:hypothetical protein
MHKMRGVLVSYSKGLTVHSGVLIHVDCFVWFFSIDVGLLGFSIVSSLKVEFGLVKENLCNTLWVVLSGHLKSRVPILLVLIHVDGFLWLVGLNEFILSLLESLLIFQVKSILKVHLWKLVLSMVVGKFEGFVILLLVSFEVNCSFNESVLDKELGSFFSTHVLSNLNGDFTKFFL